MGTKQASSESDKVRMEESAKVFSSWIEQQQNSVRDGIE